MQQTYTITLGCAFFYRKGSRPFALGSRTPERVSSGALTLCTGASRMFVRYIYVYCTAINPDRRPVSMAMQQLHCSACRLPNVRYARIKPAPRCSWRLPSASGDAPTRSLAAEPLVDIGSLASSSAAAGAGVYAVYSDASVLQYIGVSRNIQTSCASHGQLLPAGVASRVKVWRLPPGAGKAELQGAWKAWITEWGSLPPGNAPGGDAAWLGRAAGAGVTRTAATPAASAEELQRRLAESMHPGAQSLVTPQLLQQLAADGFAVVDQVGGVVKRTRMCV